MTSAGKQSALLLALAALGVYGAHAQYSTPVGTGAARPKTLRATAVLEWTGSLTKPNASRLMPLAVWDGEHYQPAGLYLARPEPLAFAPGTQYVLERAGDEAALFDVRAAAQLNGQWIGMGKVEPPAPPPPPKKLKPSKQLPALAGGKSTGAQDSGRPTLHSKADTGAKADESGTKVASSTDKNADTDPVAAPPDGKQPAAAQPSSASAAAPDSGTGTETAPETGSSGKEPTLHRRSPAPGAGDGSANEGSDAPATASSKAPEVDPDRPTLHKHEDSADSASTERKGETDPDRPTLHHARDAAAAAAPTAIDPDRPHLRYGAGAPAEEGQTAGPLKLEGAPPAMQQIVAVSDAGPNEPQQYGYRWAAPADGTAMQAALATLAAQAAAQVLAPRAGTSAARQTSFGPAAAAAAARARTRARHTEPGQAALPKMVEEHFAAYELSFSAGATLVYSARTDAEASQRVYVTLIAQPDFSGKPQVIFKQVSRGDLLAETPAMQLVDAADTDGDGRAELVFSLQGGIGAPAATAADAPAATAADAATGKGGASAASPAAQPATQRQFAIYRVADRRVDQVFTTGPLP